MVTQIMFQHVFNSTLHVTSTFIFLLCFTALQSICYVYVVAACCALHVFAHDVILARYRSIGARNLHSMYTRAISFVRCCLRAALSLFWLWGSANGHVLARSKSIQRVVLGEGTQRHCLLRSLMRTQTLRLLVTHCFAS